MTKTGWINFWTIPKNVALHKKEVIYMTLC